MTRTKWSLRPQMSFYVASVTSLFIGGIALGVFRFSVTQALALAVMCWLFLGAVSAIVYEETRATR